MDCKRIVTIYIMELKSLGINNAVPAVMYFILMLFTVVMFRTNPDASIVRISILPYMVVLIWTGMIYRPVCQMQAFYNINDRQLYIRYLPVKLYIFLFSSLLEFPFGFGLWLTVSHYDARLAAAVVLVFLAGIPVKYLVYLVGTIFSAPAVTFIVTEVIVLIFAFRANLSFIYKSAILSGHFL